MLKDFIEATKRGKCDVIDNRFVKRDTSGNSHNPNPNCSPSSSSSPSSSPDSNSDRIFTAEHGAAWTTSHDRWSTTKQDQRFLQYINTNNQYGYALMQKLPYKESGFTEIILDAALKTSDESDYGYWIYIYMVICDLNYTDGCRDSTRCFHILPLK